MVEAACRTQPPRKGLPPRLPVIAYRQRRTIKFPATRRTFQQAATTQEHTATLRILLFNCRTTLRQNGNKR